jgi:alpha-mannosidase
MDTHGLETWEKFEVGRHLLKENGNKVWNYTLDYERLKEHVKDEICPHVGAFFGVGDGGHGPTHKEVAVANELVKDLLCKWSRVGSFFEEVEKYSESFPVWNDELYLENHRGCNSNHWEVKRHNRKYENMIVSLENLALLISLTNPEYKYPKDQLEKLWKITLKNQFHDVLPGSSIPEVYDEVWDDWNEQDASIRNIIENIGKAITVNQKIEATLESAEFLLYNQLPWERESRVFIPITVFKNFPRIDKEGKPNFAKLELLNENNEVFVCQPISAEPDYGLDSIPAGWWIVINLKPLGLTRARITIQSDSTSEDLGKRENFRATENSISSENIKIKLDHDTGAIDELIVNEINKGNNLLKGNSSNLTYGFLDKGTTFPAWNLVRQYWNYPIELSNEKDVKIRVTEIGPIFATIEISRTLGISSVTQKITLFRNCPEIYLEYNSNWKQENIMLKILYSTSTDAEIAIADETYCAITFKTKPETPCDKARYEKICHKYFDISTNDKSWGLALLNEGKYAFDVNGGDIRLTLLRACLYPPPAPEAWVNLERSENEKLYGHTVPRHSGIGPFRCRYALLPHNGGALVDAKGTPNVIVKRKAEEFNNPVMIIPLYNSQINSEEIEAFGDPLLQILTPNVFLGALKLNEWDNTNNIIARFVESSGIPSVVKIKLNSKLSNKISSISAVDLLEREIQYKFEWDNDMAILSFEIGKFEISTFKFRI